MKALTAFLLASAVGLVLAAGSSLAATDSSSIEVSATTVDACEVTTLPLAFGLYDPSADKEAEGAVLATCSAGVEFWIGLGDGDQPVQIQNPVRRLWDPIADDYLFYELYQDSGRSVPWGDGGAAPGTDMGPLTGTGAQVTYPVYGRISAGQYSTPGDAYEDGVQVTLIW